ncbi:MAG: DUF58 domain-containing protein [Phycisphaeraceae bacterium]
MAEQRLVDAKGLSLVARMELVARKAVEGVLSGVHPSPYFGSSIEYADHRPYTIGDEIRTIDWKLLAKTDKHYVKLFEEQTNTRCTVLLDTSRSMSFKGDGPMDKLTYGMFLTAALGYMALKQNDAVGLAMFDRQVNHHLPARATARHFRHMLEQMQQTQAGADTAIGPVLHDLAGKMPPRGVVILISDLLDDLDAIVDGLAHFKHLRHEVIVFHLMDPAERHFPYDKMTRFRDIEGAGSVIANPHDVKKAYMRRLTAFMDKMRRLCLERDIGYQLAQTDQGYAQMLSAFLSRRAKLR